MINLELDQQRALAEAVTGKEWIICTFGPNGGGVPCIANKNDPYRPLWKPDKHSDQWKALCVWIAKHLPKLIITEDYEIAELTVLQLHIKFRKAQAEEDILILVELGVQLNDN